MRAWSIMVLSLVLALRVLAEQPDVAVVKGTFAAKNIPGTYHQFFLAFRGTTGPSPAHVAPSELLHRGHKPGAAPR